MRRLTLALLLLPWLCAANMPGRIGGGAIRGQMGKNVSNPLGAPPAKAVFTAASGDSGIDNLSSTLTINGASQAAKVWCEGRDASTTWVCDIGWTLSLAGSGASPTTGVATPFTSGDTGVKGVGAKYYNAADTSWGQITTGDIVVEAIYVSGDDDKYLTGAWQTTNGWGIRSVSGSSQRLILTDDSTTKAITTNNSCASGWCHLMCFVNRDEASTNGAVCYGNGIAGTGVDCSGIAGDMTSANTFDILANGAGVSLFSGRVALVALWERASWHQAGASGPAEWATIAQTRLHQLMGTYPSLATTYLPTFTRGSNGNLRIWNGTSFDYFKTSTGWPRVEKWSGGKGVISEPSAQNIILQSQTFGTSWAKVYATDTLAENSATLLPPTGEATADTLAFATNTTTHGMSQAVTTTAESWVFSAYLRAGASPWATLNDETVANSKAYFNLSTCAAGTAGANVSLATCENYGGSWCRCSIAVTATAAPNTFSINGADADNDDQTEGDGSTVDLAFWGAQVELDPGSHIGTSYITTTTAGVTRAADSLYWSVSNQSSAGTLSATVLCPSRDQLTATGLLGLSDGTANNAMLLGAAASGDVATWTGATGGVAQWSISGATDIYDNTSRSIRGWYKSPNRLYVGSTTDSSTDDTSSTTPTTTRLYIGDHAGGNGSRCLISNVNHWKGHKKP